MSCDWWTAGHVTTVLLSDWSPRFVDIKVQPPARPRNLIAVDLLGLPWTATEEEIRWGYRCQRHFTKHETLFVESFI